MPTHILMPALVAGMTEGTLARWLKKPGDRVSRGEPLAEIESDKATIELEAEGDGILGDLLVRDGTTGVLVNAPLAVLLPVSGGTTQAPVPSTAGISATGSAAGALAGVEPGPGDADVGREVPLSNARRIAAQRLSQSKATIPHFYLTIDCAVDSLLKARDRLNSESRAPAARISITDMAVRAAAVALERVPGVNVAWVDGKVLQFSSVDVSVAVATDAGVFTPVVRGANGKSLQQISEELAGLAERARTGALMPDEFRGGHISVSNLGMHGITDFAAIISPPQSCILALGTCQRRPVVSGDQIIAATMMSCTLSADHRLIDGVLGAQYLQAFRTVLEDPASVVG